MRERGDLFACEWWIWREPIRPSERGGALGVWLLGREVRGDPCAWVVSASQTGIQEGDDLGLVRSDHQRARSSWRRVTSRVFARVRQAWAYSGQ